MRRLTFVVFVITLLASCGGGSGGNSKSYPPMNLQGAVIDGPLANADIAVYRFEDGSTGELVEEGSTDENGFITGITLAPAEAPFILIATAIPDLTTEVNGGEFPQLTELKTVVTASQLINIDNQPIFITPITTLVTDLALELTRLASLSPDHYTIPYSLEELVGITSKKVLSTVGFGMPVDADVFTTPPIILDTTDPESLVSVLEYRVAIEALKNIFEEYGEVKELTSDEALTSLVADLVDDEIQKRYEDPYRQYEILSLANLIELVPDFSQSDIEILLGSDALDSSIENPSLLNQSGEITESVIINILPGNLFPDIDEDGSVDKYDQCYTYDGELTYDVDGDGCEDFEEDYNGACFHAVLVDLAPLLDFFMQIADAETYENVFAARGQPFSNADDVKLLSELQLETLQRFFRRLPPQGGNLGGVVSDLIYNPYLFFRDTSILNEFMSYVSDNPLVSLTADSLNSAGEDIFLRPFGYSSDDVIQGCGVYEQ